MPIGAAELSRDVRALTERLGILIETMESGGIGNSRVNQTVGLGGAAVWIAATCCVACLVLALTIILFDNRSYMELSKKIDTETAKIRAQYDPQVDQLRAWNDVHTKDIARLQAGQEKH